MTLIIIAVGLSGISMAGWAVNHLDLAPPFAGIYTIIKTTGLSVTVGVAGWAWSTDATVALCDFDMWRLRRTLTYLLTYGVSQPGADAER